MQRHRGRGRGRGRDKDIARNTVRVKENGRGRNNIKSKKNAYKAGLRDRSVANCLHIHNLSIHAPFSVTRFVISGGYYRGSFEYVIESIVR